MYIMCETLVRGSNLAYKVLYSTWTAFTRNHRNLLLLLVATLLLLLLLFCL